MEVTMLPFAADYLWSVSVTNVNTTVLLNTVQNQIRVLMIPVLRYWLLAITCQYLVALVWAQSEILPNTGQTTVYGAVSPPRRSNKP